MIYSFNIDEKSLFFGIKNDFRNGQTATVHTPLNQAKDKKYWRNDVYSFLEGYSSENINNLPVLLKDKCLRKTTSEADSVIVSFFVFSNMSIDGIPFDSNSSFAMYVKEETSVLISKRNGECIPNTHIGRQKLHYPISLSHFSDGYNINNREVLQTILRKNGGFAYVVNGFDINTQTKELNFRTTMVGLEGVLLSNVFKRKKGIGSKLLINGILDQLGIVLPTNTIISNEENSSFIATINKIQETSRANGKTGEEYVYNNIDDIIGQKITEKAHISKKYPLSPYDIECLVNGSKLYIEVKSTEKDKKTFFMSRGERHFMDTYQNNYMLVLVTNVKSNHIRHFKYQRKDIMNEKIMRQEIQSIKFNVK